VCSSDLSGGGGTNATFNATTNGTLTLAGSIFSTYPAVAQRGGDPTEGISGNITQAANARLHVDNVARFVTFGGDIKLDNNGNSNGRVEFSTGGGIGLASSGNISYTEDPTVRLGRIDTLANASITSRFGAIIDDSAGTAINVGGVLTLNAPQSVTLTAGNTTGSLASANITTSGAAALSTTSNLVLGTIAANSLTVTANSISQSGPLNVFGLSSFTATNAVAANGGGISLTNDQNNFGPISVTVTAPNQSISIVERNTLNLRMVSMPGGGNGTFTANSVNGDIIDSGFGGVAFGGTTAAGGNGLVSLLATNGNIVLDDFTTSVNVNPSTTGGGLIFNAKDVTISLVGAVGSNITLGAAGQTARATGNLSVVSVSGSINQNGPVRADSGTASFQATSGAINLVDVGNGFGTLRFVGNTVSVTESGSILVGSGSSSVGPASLRSVTDSIIIPSNLGGVVSFGSTVRLDAAKNITLTKLMTAVGQVTLFYTGTANLSGLSQTTDLNNIAPINGGSAGSTYVGPGQ